MSSAALRVIPLGGCGEVGLNATLLVDEASRDAILVDCGVMFADGVPGVDRFIPDFTPLHAHGRRLRAVVITHGHEDHIGALGDLFLEADVPIFGLALPIGLARARLEARGMPSDRLQVVSYGQRVTLGAFVVEWVRVTHSIPDAAALAIETPAGRVIHSGDFKLDPDPLDGGATDLERLRGFGADLLLSDSTNAEQPGRTTPEHRVATELEAIAAETPGRVVVACFASHLHRLLGLSRAAERSRRDLVLLGTSLHRNYQVARATGHGRFEVRLDDDLARIARIPPRRLLLAVTGSQGEPRAALAKLAQGELAGAGGEALGPDDRIVLSATQIPGNERAIRGLINAFARLGVPVIENGARCVHCSGHAHQDEQRAMLAAVRPRAFVPIHGDRAMLEAHARLARDAGVAHVEILEDGQGVRLTPGGFLDRVPTEHVTRRPIDLASNRRLEPEVLALREQLARFGLVRATVLVQDGRPVGAELEALGVSDAARLEPRLREAAEAELAVDPRDRPQPLEERLQTALKRAGKRFLGMAPVVHVGSIDLRRSSGS